MSIEGLHSYYEENKTRYNMLTEEECEKILLTTFEIAETVGVNMKSVKARKLLEKNGCKVDGERVYLPAEVIKEAIRSTPPEMVLYDQDKNEKLHIRGTNFYYGLGPTTPFFEDPYTEERRPSTRQDAANVARVADALQNIDFLMGEVGIQDCNPNLASVYEMYEMIINSKKPKVSWGVGIEDVQEVIDLCAAVAGGIQELQEKSFLMIYAGGSVTPLQFGEDVTDKLAYIVEQKIPVVFAMGLNLGVTSPVTIAGALAMGFVELLTGLCLAQYTRKGAPFVGTVGLLTSDMKTTHSCYGSPEFCIAGSAVADIMHYLNLLNWSASCASDSKAVDEQAALEAAMTSLTMALSGAHMIHDCGFLEGAISSSLDMIVMSDEIIGYAKHVAKGMEVNDETLALDLIKKVGPGGEFLTSMHTMKHFREVIWMPEISDRRKYCGWVADKTTMKQRVHEKVLSILKSQAPETVSPDVIYKMDKILVRAESRFSK